MRKSLIALAVTVALLGLAPGMAGAAPGVNTIGIFFDQSGSAASACTVMSTAAPLTAYVLALNISEPSGISGWELCLAKEGNFPAGLSVTLTGQAFNAFTAPMYQVGLTGAPLPYAPAITLMTLSTFYIGGTYTLKFGLGPTTPTSFASAPEGPGPGYVRGDDVSVIHRLTEVTNVPIAGQPGFFWVAFVNDSANCPITATEESTWGGVKALYK